MNKGFLLFGAGAPVQVPSAGVAAPHEFVIRFAAGGSGGASRLVTLTVGGLAMKTRLAVAAVVLSVLLGNRRTQVSRLAEAIIGQPKLTLHSKTRNR